MHLNGSLGASRTSHPCWQRISPQLAMPARPRDRERLLAATASVPQRKAQAARPPGGARGIRADFIDDRGGTR
jgi:hypothetical protein